ncbi:multiple sugar transport system substrate-binding protein [Streptosporangium becharense]|uniref:Multiple sugar transport system substrate-binding protein n=1 Tax=Streptosporangium becharense TaxID=1816182 RepID=A0A7W9MF24_9ACTN|nr:ABC transporter substrate-binding protein [Streptosporangium becharense]MBB2912030.1 multiple sugar transport system substrate-binding protein [Streptosporangium becharense]MBB5818577.1 multiple sugar transport system substrate-binding protein [Streptosporangium becharense]
MTSPLSRRSFLGLTGAAGLTAALTACGGGTRIGADSPPAASAAPSFAGGEYTGPKVTLDYWNGFTGGDGPHMRAMLEAFNKEYSGRIEVRNVTRRWEDLYPAMPTAISAGKGPDVAVIHNDWIGTFAARRTLIPLDDVVGALRLGESDFIPAVWNAGVYDGRRYSVPLDVHSLGDYWNRAHLEKAGLKAAPADRAGYQDALAALKDAGIENPFWMPSKWPAHLMFMSLLWQFGGELYSEDGTRALWGSDRGAQALAWMVEQIDKGFSPAKVAQDSQYAAFKNDKVSFTWDGIWQINDLKANAPSLKWDLAPVPNIGGTAAVWASSHNFVLTAQAGKDPAKVQAAKFFIDHMSRRSTEWARAGMIPARNSVRRDPAVAGLPQIGLAADVNAFHFLPALPGVGDVQSKALELAVAKAVLKEASPADALKEGVATADKLLAENKRKYGG